MITENFTMYKKDNTGKIREWSIQGDDIWITMNYGVVNGAMQTKYEEVLDGKATRTQEEQLLSRISSRIKKQKDKGYVDSYEYAMNNHPTNSLGLLRPMKAQRYDQVANVDLLESYIQNKYNGHRCIIHRNEDGLIAYSNNGKIITSIDHILSDINLEVGQYIDGELYHHRTPLQTISSWVKREQENTLKLEFVAFDLISSDSFKRRLEALKDIGLKESARVAETRKTNTISSIAEELNSAISAGYEGLIIRQGDTGYEDGKRSRSVIKVKKCFDDEFKVIDVLESVDGWGILKCVTDIGREFRVSAPGCITQKTFILRNKQDYIGRFVRVEFFERTNNMTPFHPVAIMFRDKEAE
ncbi:MAG TPA: hypothetical protein ENK81_00195 [Euryarchaeota archaeon]|nr:hypothetical protein [Euryarchaeota archaeon]